MKKSVLMGLSKRTPDEIEMNKNNIIVRDHIISENTTFPMHFHDYFELEIIVSGKTDYTLNNEKINGDSGSVFLLSYYDYHCFTALTDIQIINIRFNNRFLSKELTELIAASRHIHCKLEKNSLDYIVGRIARLKEYINSSDGLKKILAGAIATEIIAFIVDMSDLSLDKKSQKTINKIVNYTQSNFEKNITLKDIAEKFAITPNYLGFLFKNTMGISFTKYLANLRLEYACNLLVDTDLPTKEIAGRCGYNSNAYFLAAFKRTFNKTPTEYRNNPDL